jgi:Domain of unknown function (DUF4336)
VAEQPLRFLGLELGARMTLVRLAEGGLLLHSPIRPTEQLLAAVRSLGHVAAIVAPNRFHHLFAGDWLGACPGSRLFVAPGLEAKRPDLAVAGVLGDEPEPLWKGVLEQALIQGYPLSNEVVFFHPASRTLIASDLAFHMTADRPARTRLVFRLSGGYGRLAPTFVERLFVRDRAGYRASLERVLEWPFERVIVAHGAVLESDGRRELARGFGWLLSD